ncbi:hypothetical protein QR98_0019850 [Sarcoptes scabiei]|uniref:Uncharacterized protein n=1 Tax=Sarcoptes scabiei TaxID=52283 RepID=A0A131ZXH2_SARSC|nr:hypothetical protein QR98_0019850 [Sarcoptes scabiei]
MLNEGVIRELDLVVTTSADGRGHIYKLATGELRHVLMGHEGPINCLATDGRFIYTAGADAIIKIWDENSNVTSMAMKIPFFVCKCTKKFCTPAQWIELLELGL